MAVKKSALYSALWKSCDELRGSMDASQYKDYVLVMLFWKYISDKQKSDPYAIKVPKGCSFDDIAKLKNQAGIGDQLNKKLEEIAKVYNLGIGFFSNSDFNNEENFIDYFARTTISVEWLQVKYTRCSMPSGRRNV